MLSRPTFNLAIPSPSLNHVLKCLTYTWIKYLQGRWLNLLLEPEPWKPDAVLDNSSFLVNKFFIIANLNLYCCNLRSFPLSDMRDQEKTTIGTSIFRDKEGEILKARKSGVLEG